MTSAVLLFLYGLAAGFLLMRLRKRRALAEPPRGALWATAWLTMAISFALAGLLIAWGLWAELG
jgi:hypothetical protein